MVGNGPSAAACGGIVSRRQQSIPELEEHLLDSLAVIRSSRKLLERYNTRRPNF
jgi:hypothetical protein